jgi:hypothetical protein
MREEDRMHRYFSQENLKETDHLMRGRRWEDTIKMDLK